MILNDLFLKPLNMEKHNKAIDKSIEAIKNKLKELVKDRNRTAFALKLNINKNYFTDLAKKKTFTITELQMFSEELNYNFFSLIETKTTLNTELKPEKKRKSTRVAITIEVEDEEKERIILESAFDKITAKKLIG